MNKANAGFITVKDAAQLLGLSERQTQRLKKKVRENGPAALVHGNTSRKPARALGADIKKKILKVRTKPGFRNANFRHFQELLETEEGIRISYSALCRILKEEGIKSPKKRRRFKPHRRRKRRGQAGELLQGDATPFDWFKEGRNRTLHGAIDDATGQVTGLYMCENECMLGYHEVLRRTIGNYGVPSAMYVDRHTIFRSPNADKKTPLDLPQGTAAHETQFGRCLSELSIQLIVARSPQAKGRVERLWQTLQSRLPVEFEIRGIKDMDAANRFLESYIYAYNSEFAVEPSDPDGAFRPLGKVVDLDNILCIKETRTLDRGQTFSYNGRTFSIAKCHRSSWVPPRAKVTVLASPLFGVRASYKNLVFETELVPKAPKGTKAPTKEAKPRKTKEGHGWPFVSKTGAPWRPGLPTDQECYEALCDIFLAPFTIPKGTPDDAETC